MCVTDTLGYWGLGFVMMVIVSRREEVEENAVGLFLSSGGGRGGCSCIGCGGSGHDGCGCSGCGGSGCSRWQQ